MYLSNRNIPAIILIFIISIGCNHKKLNGDKLQRIYARGMKSTVKNIKELHVIDSTSIKLDLSDVDFESKSIVPIRFMKLCPKNEILIGIIDKIVHYKDRIYILDKVTNSLLILDIDGNMIFKIHNVGKAGGEYNTISDFCIDDKHQKIVIFDAKSKKFIHYNLNGKFYKEYKTLIWLKEFSILNTGDYCMLTLGNDYSGYQLLFSDSLHRIRQKAIPVNSGYLLNLFSNGKSLIQNYNEATQISAPFSNKIYRIRYGRIYLDYILDFGEREFKYEKDKHRNMNMFIDDYDNNKLMFSLGGFMETDINLLVELTYKGKGYVVNYKKDNKSLTIQSLILLDSLHITFPKIYIEDCFVSIINSVWMIENKDLMIKKYGLEKFYSGLTVNSNPILVFYKVQ